MAIISTKDLTKVYGKLTALDHLTIDIEEGEILGYLGPNGAGKTTTIRLLLGLIKPTSGTSTIFGLDSQKRQKQIHKDLAYIPGEANLWGNLTGKETLNLLGKAHGFVDKTYQKDLIEMFNFEPDKKVKSYSKGNKQKINIIAALSTRAKLLVLDEPTSGLDPLMEKTFREQILIAKQNSQTVLLSSHILEEVEALADKIAVIRNGSIVEYGSLDSIRKYSALAVRVTFERLKDSIHAKNSVAALQGVNNLTDHEGSLSFSLSGDFNDLLGILSQYKINKIVSQEPNLEEVFLNLYGE